eukprot:364343-Chlamydomonas_euryale.AAC.7
MLLTSNCWHLSRYAAGAPEHPLACRSILCRPVLLVVPQGTLGVLHAQRSPHTIHPAPRIAAG